MTFLIQFYKTSYLLQGSPQRFNHQNQHSSAHATPLAKPRSKSKNECSSLEKRRLSRGSGVENDLETAAANSSQEEYTKMLRRRMISEVLHQNSKPTVFDLTRFRYIAYTMSNYLETVAKNLPQSQNLAINNESTIVVQSL